MGKINQYNDNGFIPKHGGYQKLLSFQKAEIVYDGTVYFCRRFFSKFDRTVDQMVQAARSGKQNIAEASMASGTSKSTEIKLTNVARASLEELLLDYRDFLRINHFKEWEKESPYYKRMTELNKSPNQSYETYRRAIENEDPEICANAMIGLIKVTNFLLDRQLKRLEEDFLREGGFKEKMTNARLKERKKGTERN